MHDRHARFRFPIQNRPVDGRCAAIARQNGGMNVDGAVFRLPKYRPAEFSRKPPPRSAPAAVPHNGRAVPSAFLQVDTLEYSLTRHIPSQVKMSFYGHGFSVYPLGKHATDLVPSATRRFSEGTANAGVPINRIFMLLRLHPCPAQFLPDAERNTPQNLPPS